MVKSDMSQTKRRLRYKRLEENEPWPFMQMWWKLEREEGLWPKIGRKKYKIIQGLLC
jgi:hypothetical protein